jgi:OmcA/MtrC family decaheme c-type cytochrome
VFPTPANPLIYPEAPDNMRDLIHRTHAAGIRDLTNPYKFVRDRGLSGVYYYDLSTVEFPGIINLCETCHRPGTYDGTLPTGVLPTTEVSGGNGLVSRAAVTAARAAVPAAADIVISPFTGTCIACHDSTLTRTHMNQNGGLLTILVDRATYSANKDNETCVLCHSAGRIADPAVVHILPLSLPAEIVP